MRHSKLARDLRDLRERLESGEPLRRTVRLTKWRRLPGGRWWRLEVKVRDLWIGAFWTDHELWVCLLPCLPVHIMRQGRKKEGRK